MRVRGFTRHAASGVRFPGTYAGIEMPKVAVLAAVETVRTQMPA